MAPNSHSPQHRHAPSKEAVITWQQEMEKGREYVQGLPPEQQQEFIEDRAFHALETDEEGSQNVAELEQARSMGDRAKETEIIARQRSRHQAIRSELAFMWGVDLYDTEAQKVEYRAKLLEVADALGSGSSDDEIMEGLGFVQTDQETGEKKFTFPEELFPPYIREKWEQYAKYVENHVRAARIHELGIMNNADEVVRWDYVRRLAHNELAESVQDFLHLDNWDTERCRKFITKMLERRIPTIETSESKLTASALRRVVTELRAISEASASGDHPQ